MQICDDANKSSSREEVDEEETQLRHQVIATYHFSRCVHEAFYPQVLSLFEEKTALRAQLDSYSDDETEVPVIAAPPPTFFSPELERLIEGLPNAINCIKYKSVDRLDFQFDIILVWQVH